jgi:hypothetical protein
LKHCRFSVACKLELTPHQCWACRNIELPSGIVLKGLIQTSAPINPGRRTLCCDLEAVGQLAC